MPEPLATRIARTVTAAEAARLGFAGWLARHTGQADPRPQGERLHHRVRDGALLEAAVALTAGFDAAGVSHVVARGVALLGDVYEPGDRVIADVDCYIPHDAVEGAVAELERLGYVPDLDAGSPEGMGRGRTFTRTHGVPVTVDLHWGLARADRLITYGESGLLTEVWERSTVAGGVRVPDPAAHAGLIVHHLVYHDLLHARGLLDALLLWPRLQSGDHERLATLARRWRVARAVAALTQAAADPHAATRGGLAALFTPERLLPAALAADPVEGVEVTPRRVRRRLRLLDHWWQAPRLLRDVILPPGAYLRWRWPDRSVSGAWWQHVRRQVSRVMFPT